MGIQLTAFNHLLNQHPAVCAALSTHAGRRIAIVLPPLKVVGVITEQGGLASCNGAAEATLRLKHAAVLATVCGRDPALADVTLDGDAELAAAVGHLVRHLRWDAVEDLSRIIGDIAAQRVENVARGLLGFKAQLAWRLAENGLEYLREEAQLLASKHQVNDFIQQVDSLRDDASRLEKRLARLETALTTSKNEI